MGSIEMLSKLTIAAGVSSMSLVCVSGHAFAAAAWVEPAAAVAPAAVVQPLCWQCCWDWNRCCCCGRVAAVTAAKAAYQACGDLQYSTTINASLLQAATDKMHQLLLVLLLLHWRCCWRVYCCLTSPICSSIRLASSMQFSCTIATYQAASHVHAGQSGSQACAY
jgi:hypothetical protein